MKKLIYVVDSKKNFAKCQKKQHFCSLLCEIHYFDRFFGAQFIAAWRSLALLGRSVHLRQLQKGRRLKSKFERNDETQQRGCHHTTTRFGNCGAVT
jgi:hypothetical protein